MGRIRTFKPEFPQSESMGRVSRDARLLFLQLFTLADDSGRLRGNSRMLASLLYPYDDDAGSLIDDWLDELDREDCIRRYRHESDTYVEICNWLKHQKIDKPSASKFPKFDESSRIFATARERSSGDQGSRIKEGIKERKGSRRGSKTTKAKAEAAVSVLEPAVAFIPLRDGSEYGIEKSFYEELQAAYPQIDVMAEFAQCRAWNIANPTEQKTANGIKRHLNRWMQNEIENLNKPKGQTYGNQPKSFATIKQENTLRGAEKAFAVFEGIEQPHRSGD